MIKENVQNIIAGLPRGVTLVGAAKTRSADEILEAVAGGLRIVGENYVQEAEKKRPVVGNEVSWHLLGHLQKNKVKKAVKIFDMIQTVDSAALARKINQECEPIAKVMPVLIEVNSARESQKTGVAADEVLPLADEILKLPCLSLEGLMTMGPLSEDQTELRRAFDRTRQLYEHTGAKLKREKFRYLSMGMSLSFKLAIEAGANMVRIGTLLFGERPSR